MQLAFELLLRGLALSPAVADRQFVASLERLVVAQVLRHQEVEYGPHVGDRVLDRSAGQHQPLPRVKVLRRLGVSRLAVLYVLRFIQDKRRELPVEVGRLEVALQKGV